MPIAVPCPARPLVRCRELAAVPLPVVPGDASKDTYDDDVVSVKGQIHLDGMVKLRRSEVYLSSIVRFGRY